MDGDVGKLSSLLDDILLPSSDASCSLFFLPQVHPTNFPNTQVVHYIAQTKKNRERVAEVYTSVNP